MPMQPAEASQTDPHEPAGKAPTRRRLSNGLLALGSAAVAAVYAVGYASTQSSVDDLTAALDVPTASVGAAVPTVGPSTAGGGAAAGPRPAAKGAYVDGAYTGTGSSRHGSITVSVVIEGGEIVSAAVTDCETRYPCSDVNPLASEVLTTGGVPTNNVSGATDSSRAYRAAVTQALQKALGGV